MRFAYVHALTTGRATRLQIERAVQHAATVLDQQPPERRQRLIDVVTTIVDGIDAGIFPAVPGEWNNFRNTHENCTYCEFDRVCSRDRGEHAEAKVGAPELRIRERLLPEAP